MRIFSILWQEVSVLSAGNLLFLSIRQSSLEYTFKMEWLGSRKENCLFSLSWLLDKRQNGKTDPSLRVSAQMHPGTGGLQASTLSGGENCGLLRRQESRHRARSPRWWKERDPKISMQICCIPGSRCCTSKWCCATSKPGGNDHLAQPSGRIQEEFLYFCSS